MSAQPIVYVVDDEPSVLSCLRWLIESANFAVAAFGSGEEFLRHVEPERPGCLLLDMNLSGMQGLELLGRLKQEQIEIPAIVLTGCGELETCLTAFRVGAYDVIEKPPDESILLARISKAVELNTAHRRLRSAQRDFSSRLMKLTPRETSVMRMIVAGRSQKFIAADLGISIQTVGKHRARILAKLNVENDVELVRLTLGHADHRHLRLDGAAVVPPPNTADHQVAKRTSAVS